MIIDQISKHLLIKDKEGKAIGMKGEITIKPCKGQMRNPDKKINRLIKKREKRIKK